MKPRNHTYNPKRTICSMDREEHTRVVERAAEATYGGNPEHKLHPGGNYNLTPPCSPRPGKTLCDADREFSKTEALTLLRSGLKRGMFSERMRGPWPQNVWAVSDDGHLFEAQLENKDMGTYHGYPMPKDDDFREIVVEEWKRRAP